MVGTFTPSLDSPSGLFFSVPKARCHGSWLLASFLSHCSHHPCFLDLESTVLAFYLECFSPSPYLALALQSSTLYTFVGLLLLGALKARCLGAWRLAPGSLTTLVTPLFHHPRSLDNSFFLGFLESIFYCFVQTDHCRSLGVEISDLP